MKNSELAIITPQEGGATRSLNILTEDDQVYHNYIPTTIDPGNKLLIIALLICIFSVISLPFAVEVGRKRIAKAKKGEGSETKALIPKNARDENTYSEHTDEPPVENVSCVEEGNVDKRVSIHHFDRKQNDMSQDRSLRTIIQNSIRYTFELAKCDNESKRILHLALPFMTNKIIRTTSDLALLAIISRKLGTDSMIAFAMVKYIVGVTSSFTIGWIDTINSLGSMAQGAQNYELVGMHVQSAVLVYLVQTWAMAFVWVCVVHKIILLFGFSENTASVAGEYVWVYCANDIVAGILRAFIDFLGIIDRERLGMIFSCSCDMGNVYFTAVLLYTTENKTLTSVGLIVLANTCLFLLLTILISYWKKLLHPYKYGMIGRLSLSDMDVVETLITTGLSLAVGGFLAHAEWEVLTVFSAVLGPAEAATWAVLGFVWDVFESSTEAIGDAAEIRCAYHLGKGRSEMAKLSAYKSMLLSFVVASIITSVFLSLDKYLPALLTSDDTIQGFLVKLFPLMGLGNITMTVGMVSWYLLGAQARYKLATIINMTTSTLISIPLGAIMTLRLHIDLQGLTFSIVIAYVACAWLMLIVILVSDWEALSIEIRQRVANGELEIESCSSSEGSGLYKAYSWNELPDEIRTAAELLGFKESLWDNGMESELTDADWSNLTREQREAATLLGYDANKWNMDRDKQNYGSNGNDS